MQILWKRDFAIGVVEIDGQHQELFARFDRLLTAIQKGSGPAELRTTFAFLDDYTRRHFRAEEELQRRSRYPHLPMHRDEHRGFEARLSDLKERLEREGATEDLAHLTSHVLVQWLIEHICRLDRDLAGYLVKHQTEEWERWLKNNF